MSHVFLSTITASMFPGPSLNDINVNKEENSKPGTFIQFKVHKKRYTTTSQTAISARGTSAEE